jgi:hypothetical protein
MKDPGWDGPMTGQMRGRPLIRCAKHGGWWHVDKPCPACLLEAENEKLRKALKAALEGK